MGSGEVRLIRSMELVTWGLRRLPGRHPQMWAAGSDPGTQHHVLSEHSPELPCPLKKASPNHGVWAPGIQSPVPALWLSTQASLHWPHLSRPVSTWGGGGALATLLGNGPGCLVQVI